MKDSKKYFHPETIKRINRLELRAKYIVEGVLSGMHRSAFFGQSIEFRQHRDYVQGDDPRHVDWKLWARQDKLYVKQFEEETDLSCQLLVDTSASMEYGSTTFTKFDYAATLACCLTYLILKQKDSVGCSLFDTNIRNSLPIKGRSNQLDAVAGLFETRPASSETSIDQVIRQATKRLGKKCLVVILSDFFVELNDLKAALQLLRSQGHDVLLIQILDRDEVEFPFDRPTRFEGMEIANELKCNPIALRDSYLEAFREFQHELMKCASSSGTDFEFSTTDMAFNTVISSLLNKRASRQKA